MDLSLMAKQSTVARTELISIRSLWISDSRRTAGSRSSRIGFEMATARRSGAQAAQLSLRAVRSEISVEERKSPSPVIKKQASPVQLYVGLPLDSVSAQNTVNHSKAIAAGLRALKLLGAEGVELPVWWAVVQPDSPDQFDWSAYLAVAGAVRDAGLRLRVSLHLHGSHALPAWVGRAAASDPDVRFTDRCGRRHPSCLSLAVDDLPVLNGVSPMQAFEGFFLSFRSAFADLIGSTITEVTVGLGPDGELRYPSFPPTTAASNGGISNTSGVGEFQCYDKYMLDSLKKHAEAVGRPLWGLSGPHDVPVSGGSPDSSSFFKDHGGSWETQYGDFFLSWYSNLLLSHGDRVLSLASKVFGDSPLRLSGKIPLVHSWHNTRSRAAELTAGFYNTEGRDGYDAVAELFARNSCTMILPGADLDDQLLSSPQSLLSQIMAACERHGVRVSGENSKFAGIGDSGFGRIKDNLLDEGSVMDSFTYQRMGAHFFSPEHWPRFMEFARSLSFALPELGSDDRVSYGRRVSLSSTEREREMQAV